MAGSGPNNQRETAEHEGVERPDEHAGSHWSPIFSWGVPHPTHDEAPHRPRQRLYVTLVLVCAVVLATGVALGATLGPSSPPLPAPASTPTSSATATPAAGAPSDAAALAKAAQGALVDIKVVDSYQAVEGAGSGMVLTPTGVVLTNKHVIEGETSISLRDVGNETWYHAHVLGYDRSLDVAVLQLVGASHLQKVKFGNSSKVSEGEGVIAGGKGGGGGRHA
jgi:S1-C subfamily serine protease